MGTEQMKKIFSKNDTLAMKGIAILIMMQHHLFLSADRFKGYEISFYPFPQQMVIDVSLFFKICVGIYAFLSAYGLALSFQKMELKDKSFGKTYADFCITRYIKLMWGFWFIFILCMIASAIIKPAMFDKYFIAKGQFQLMPGIWRMMLDFLGVAKLFHSPNMNGTWWYMSFAIIIVLLVPLVVKLNEKLGAILPVVFVLVIPRLMMPYDEFNVGNDGESMIKWMFIAVLGVLFAKYDVLATLKSKQITKNKYLSKTIKFIILTVILLGTLYFRTQVYRAKGHDIRNYTYEITDGLIPLFFVYYCYEFIVDIPILKHVLRFFGKHSMNIFMSHTFIRVYFFSDFIYSWKHFLIVDFMMIASALLVSIGIDLLRKLVRYDKLQDLVMKKVNGLLNKKAA